jgi:hypothetical protein
MIDSHKKQGAEAGLVIRNSFASASTNTSLYEFGKGFNPEPRFFLEPYVLGYTLSLMNSFRSFVCKGKGWPPKKTGEYIMHTFAELQRDIAKIDIKTINEAFIRNRWNPIVEDGMYHAELYFGAMVGLIDLSSTEPIVVEARDRASRLHGLSSKASGEKNDRDAGFQLAMLELTVKPRLEELFPKSPI